ncbi:putative mitochondrial protein AtMg00310 [Silene latifolia]|uniref:putative mitochondrial protein AtMg00310 n=1 Tax=Silene latifolia TaxID=37657 RepID=UPI003D77FB72
MDTEGLWARLMRVKYYPNGDIMTAKIGNYPSYTWRGVLEARDVMREGWRRRIGDGMTTRVWQDAWLPGTQTGYIVSPRGTGNEEMLVAVLLDEKGEDGTKSLWTRCSCPLRVKGCAIYG